MHLLLLLLRHCYLILSLQILLMLVMQRLSLQKSRIWSLSVPRGRFSADCQTYSQCSLLLMKEGVWLGRR